MSSKRNRNKPVRATPNQANTDAIQQHPVIPSPLIGTQTTTTLIHQGPIPHPDILKSYEAAIPGAANRIIVMAEKEQSHRHLQESSINNANIAVAEKNANDFRRGQWMAFCIAMVGMALSAILAYTGHYIVGTLFGGIELAVLVGIFLKQQHDKNKSEIK